MLTARFIGGCKDVSMVELTTMKIRLSKATALGTGVGEGKGWRRKREVFLFSLLLLFLKSIPSNKKAKYCGLLVTAFNV